MASARTTNQTTPGRPPLVRFYNLRQPSVYASSSRIPRRRRNTIGTDTVNNRLLLNNRNESPPIITCRHNRESPNRNRENANQRRVLFSPIQGAAQSSNDIIVDNDSQEINVTNIGPFIKLSLPAEVIRGDRNPRKAHIRITYE
uniref:Uncharacterized protein n=1 Tax=Octopus bimaculoides TaxID=37653 RepID=A0A0L8HE38_OCTBM